MILLAMALGCVTQIHDPNPPANVRGSPAGAVTGTLANGTQLTVDDDRGGWLHVTAPAHGWVHASITAVDCGASGMRAIAPRIRALGARARADRVAADTLLRYALHSDGGPGEIAFDAVSDLMRDRPALLIDALDQFTDAQRRTILSEAIGLSGDRAPVRAFARAVAAEPGRATSLTWQAMPAKSKAP